MWPVIAISNKFAFTRQGCFSNDKTFFIPTDDLYLLAILNSSAAFFFFHSKLTFLRGNFLEYRAQTLVDTPIRHIENTTPDDERTSLTGEAITLYTQNRQRDLLAFIEAQLAHEPERGDVVRDVLAYLAEQMSNLQAQRHEAIGDFSAGAARRLTMAELEKLHRLWTPTTTSPPGTRYSHYTFQLVSRREPRQTQETC